MHSFACVDVVFLGKSILVRRGSGEAACPSLFADVPQDKTTVRIIFLHHRPGVFFFPFLFCIDFQKYLGSTGRESVCSASQ